MNTEETTQPLEEDHRQEVNEGEFIKKQPARFIFNHESLKKQIRPSEFFAEKIITGVAFLSIAIIILIFLFVFRETIPIFSGKAEKKTEVTVLKQATYGSSYQVQNDNKQEVYGSSEPEIPVARQEVYGATADTTKDTVVSGEAGVSSYKEDESRAGNKVTLKGLTGKVWMPVSDRPRYGLLPLIVGTLKITIIAILFAAPLAILAALFSAAFAPRWMREFIKPAIEILAGFPSVVIGFFALIVMATFFQHLFGYETRLNAFVGGVAMALAAIPIIFTVTEDVMTAIPSTYKEASLALGA